MGVVKNTEKGAASQQSPISDTSEQNTSTICGESIILAEVKGVDVVDFINGAIHSQHEGSFIAVNGFKDDPLNKRKGKWSAKKAVEKLPACIKSDNNTYFNISTYYQKKGGKFRATKQNIAATHLAIIDDLGDGPGTKGQLSSLKIIPSYLVETSPGNYQAGFILKDPITNKSISRTLTNELASVSGGDKGATNNTRWARLPCGSNTKQRVVEACGGPFQTRLMLWNPELQYTPEEIAQAYGISLSGEGKKNRVPTASQKSKQNVTNNTAKGSLDPFAKWLKKKGHLSGTVSDDGWLAFKRCPWAEEHTEQDPQGAAYGPPHTGTDDTGCPYKYPRFKCFHGHCSERGITDLYDWAISEGYQPEITELIYLSLDALKDMAESIVEQTKKDVGACFEKTNAAVLFWLSKNSFAEWQRVRARLKAVTGVSVTALDKHIRPYIQKSDDDEKNIDHLYIARKAIEYINIENLLYTQNTFWKWNECGVWEQIDDRGIKQVIHAVLELELPGIGVIQSRVSGVVDVIKTECYQEGHEFNVDNDCINCMNGELRYIDGDWVLGAHVREHYLTNQIPVYYDPAANAPRFENFLQNEIFEGDEQALEKAWLISQCMGYTLLPFALFEVFIMLIGQGANGKSALLSALKALVGRKNIAAVQPSKFDNSFQRAHLHNKLANIVSELKENATIDDDRLKSIASGELTTVEKKHQDPFDLEPFSTCWFGTNHLPHTTDFTDGLFRRAIVIPFNRIFTVDEQDINLKDKFIAELPGILNIALDGLALLFDDGKFIHVKEVEEAKEAWRTENDQVTQFVEDCCEFSKDAHCTSSEIFEKYQEWAEVNGIYRKVNINTLTNRLKRFGVKQKKIEGVRCLVGIYIKASS